MQKAFTMLEMIFFRKQNGLDKSKSGYLKVNPAIIRKV